MRRLRRGLPGAHRARRQDRRTAPEPRARGVPLPAGAHRRVPRDGRPGKPVGPAGLDANRLDEGPAVRGADRRLAGGVAGWAQLARGPVLGRLRGGVRRAEQARRPRRGHVPERRGHPIRDSRPGRVVHRRPGPTHGQRLRVPDPRVGQRRDVEPVRDGRADDRDRMPALLQHDRQRIRPARRLLPGRSPLAVPPGTAGGRPAARRR